MAKCQHTAGGPSPTVCTQDQRPSPRQAWPGLCRQRHLSVLGEVATLTSIPQRGEDSSSVCFRHGQQMVSFFPHSEGSQRVATVRLSPLHTTHMHGLPRTRACTRTHTHTANKLLGTGWGSLGKSRLHATHEEAPRMLCAHYFTQES